MLSLRRYRLLLVPLILGLLIASCQSRPMDLNEPPDEIPPVPATGQIVMPTVPVHWLTDPNSSFGQTLIRHLSQLPEPELDALESALIAIVTNMPSQSADHDSMLGDAPAGSSSDRHEYNFSMVNGTQAEQPHSSSDQIIETETPQMHRESTEFAESTDKSVESSEPNKELRLKSIQSQIINFIGLSGRPPISSTMKSRTQSIPSPSSQQRDAIRVLYENVKSFPAYPADMFTEKIQSFYPTCELPKNTNSEVWNSKESMNLMFNISLPKASNGITVNVNTAKLRLYKQLLPCNSQVNNETDDQTICAPIFLEDNTKKSTTNISDSAIASLIMEEKQIRVSVYAYTKSLRKKKIKRKLLDSRMMSYYGEKWTEWNIRSAVRLWRREPFHNFGLSIEVEDEEGNVLPVHRFFRSINCSGDVQMTKLKPIPGFLMEAVQDYGLSNTETNPNMSTISSVQTLSFNIQRYPIIDVAVIEVPDSEAHNAMQYQYAKFAFEQNLAGMAASPKTEEHQQQRSEHKIRHNNHHKLDTRDYEIPEMRISKDGREFRDQIIVQGVIPKIPSTEIPG
ncbi:uncharacterized protein LOC126901853 isoform X1 [Daktulosphaira vitifoliae]|uniref:uncharacterized protein LOC126901853 isoform X1 n=1 Tax=Daktulosphaira vitifoliae TaxID=58002 RepID=UPI0021AB000F|nr:uncharacterized protein LOC126901853 isoform X1 [Daktulosphaira vitifoliae]